MKNGRDALLAVGKGYQTSQLCECLVARGGGGLVADEQGVAPLRDLLVHEERGLVLTT